MIGPFTWTDARVREALGVPPELPATPSEEIVFTGISTDTRTVGQGDLFVALVGERYDAHDFLGEAFARGARGAVVSAAAVPAGLSAPRPSGSDAGNSPPVLYPVEDTLVALGCLARHRRRALPGRVVGITGSSGKTTVKDLLAAALRGSFRVHATRGNLNNRVGVPLSLLATPEDAEMIVLEMGTSEPGEIRILAAIAEPDAGLVTTVTEAHLTGLGSFEGVLEEKLDLIRGTRPDGPTLVGDEPPILPERARAMRPGVRVAGLSERADREARARLKAPDAEGRFRFVLRGRELQAGVPGRHGVHNLVLALVLARLLGAEEEPAIEGACAVRPSALRGEVKRIGGLTVLADCYNANPQSVVAALDLLVELPTRAREGSDRPPGAGGRVAILGSMLELGNRSEALHREVLEGALALPLDAVVAVGEFARAASTLERTRADAPEVLVGDSPADGYEMLRPRLSGSETILLKASRGVAMETLLERFAEDFGPASGEED